MTVCFINIDVFIVLQYDQIDEEHKGLFNGIFDCINDNNAANLKTLLDRVNTHFKNEEATMKAKKYADFTAHQDIHKGFATKLAALKAPLDKAQVDFAKEW